MAKNKTYPLIARGYGYEAKFERVIFFIAVT